MADPGRFGESEKKYTEQWSSKGGDDDGGSYGGGFDEHRHRMRQIREEGEARNRRQQEIDAAAKQDAINKQKQSLIAKIGHGDIQEGYIGDEAFKKTQPAEQHKLRSQFDRLSAKYGPSFTAINPKTGKMSSQAQVLSDYLSGVPVERGGGLGARDPSYGGGDFDMEGLTQAELAEAEARRQDLLNKVAAGMYTQNTLADIFRDQTQADIGKGLSEDQWFNFRQQLMAADPSPGNQAYKAALPFASGQLAQGVMSLAPGIGMAGRVLKGALGKAQDVGQGIAQSIPSGLLSLFNKARDVVTSAEGQGGGGGGQQFAYQQELPVSGPIRQEETTPPYQGVIGGMPGMYQPGYGGSIGKENEMRTADFRDSDGDGVDDRDQAGPGQPPWRGYGQKFAGATPKLPQAPLAPSALTPGSALAMSPIMHQLRFQQPNPNWEQWYQNIGRFS